MPSLLVEAFESDPNRVAISSRLISVGRASDNDISVTDDLVSAHHMQLRIEGDEHVRPRVLEVGGPVREIRRHEDVRSSQLKSR